MSPLFRMTLSVIVGIFCAEAVQDWDCRLWIALIYGIIFLLACFWEWKQSFFIQKSAGVILCTLFILIGLYRSVDSQRLESTHFTHHPFDQLVIELQTYPERRTKSLRARVEVIAQIKDSLRRSCQGRLWVYLPMKDTLDMRLKPGVRLRIPAQAIRCVDSSINMGDFDFQRYLQRQHVFHQAFLHRYTYSIDSYRPLSLLFWARRVQRHLLDDLKTSGFTGYRFSIASALLLGASDQIDVETRTTFQNTGVIHVLCVSGMHVGLLANVLRFLLCFLGKKSYSIAIKAVVIIATLWAYALITGLAPSVVRATIMFSLITMGGTLKRQSNIIHSLGLAALIQLLYDPMVLFNIGFQLSYLAVLGIVWIYPIFQSVPRRFPRIIKPLWELTGVSVAAQLATAPLCILHFQQFPTYFVLSNWLASPLTSLWMPIGLLWALVQSLNLSIGTWLNWIAMWLIDVLCAGLHMLEVLPGALWTGLEIDLIEMVLMYTVLGLLMMGYFRVRRNPIRCAIAVAFALGLWHLFRV